MKRHSVFKIIGTVTLAILLITCQDCWPQISSPSVSATFTPPFRTYSLQISRDKVWVIVIGTISKAQFEIDSEDDSRLSLVAIGRPYLVRVGLGKKRERQKITIELQEKHEGIYDCFIRIEVQEFWPINNKWTKTVEDVDVQDILIQLGKILNENLKPYFRRTE